MTKKKKIYENSVGPAYFDVHDFGDFPQVNEKSDEDADLHDKVGLVVQDVKQDHE